MPLSSPVAEYMTRRPVTVSAGAPLAEAAVLMDSLHVRHLPVVGGGRVLGMLTVEVVVAEALRAGGLPSQVPAWRARLHEAAQAAPTDSMAKAASLMASTGVDAVLVGVLEGIVTGRDVVRAMVGEDPGAPAARLADAGVPRAEPGATVRAALEQMLRDGYRHVVVVEGDYVVGVFSVRDGLSVIASEGGGGLSHRLSEVITGHVYSVDPGAPGWEVIEAMAERDVGILPVVYQGRLVGAVTEWGLVRLAASRRPPGGGPSTPMRMAWDSTLSSGGWGATPSSPPQGPAGPPP